MLRDKLFTQGAPELAAWCVGQAVGSVEVLRAEWSREGDVDGCPAIFLDLTLTDPPPGERTWVYDDLNELTRRVHRKARELLAADRFYIRRHALNPEPVDAYDDEPQDEDW